ncbi:precorrin 3B synthase CobZ [Purpureocillium lavendulum]|uniref:Precorrin 3B synthase CobZ n=1 Tax=Purpureocillium lavendulum TaxID=1247861 RepID=A0AB34G1Q2_9HYPO|nr:precorrin 3B synthase CobZ [Purpureocillium lavendulum]
MRPYAMRVGGSGWLDGSLTAPLRNFILSNSTEVYEHSYLPIHLNKDLMKVAYRDKAGQNEEMVSMMSRAFLRRDPYAPVYITKDDFASFEKRNDLSSLRKQYREAKDDPVKAQKIKARIKYLLDWLERLRIQEVRKEYFDEVDRLRAQGISTHHLRTTQATNPRKQREVVGSTVAVRIGKLLDEDIAPASAATLLLAYLQEISERQVFPQEQITAHECQPAAPSSCLLCNCSYANVSSLTRHVRKHHEDTFREPFDCPECQRTGETR